MKDLVWLQLLLAAIVLSFSPVAGAQTAESEQQLQQLDINSADAAAIAATLDGVGMVKAQEIVAYREMFGHFRSVDELLAVQGIGAATLEKNRHRIVVIVQ